MSSIHKTLTMVIASVLCLLLINLSGTQSQYAPLYPYHFCRNQTTYAPNTTFQSNLNTVLSSLISSNATRNKGGFYNYSSAGRVSTDIAYGLSLCRGDVASDVCQGCVRKASTEIVQRCPDAKKAVIWYPECMLRYADRSFYSTMEDEPRISMINAADISAEGNRFQQVLGKTMYNLANKASSYPESPNPQHVKWFATEIVSVTSFFNLYGLVQCTPDLSGADCRRCLHRVIGVLPRTGISEQLGVRVLTPSCYIRYEVYPFFNITNAPSPVIPPPPPPPPSSSTKPRGKNKQISIPTVVSIVAPIICVSLALFGMAYCFIVRRKLRKENDISKEETVAKETSTAKSLQFDFGTIEAATNNFSSEKKIGEGGFGEIYKGVLINGQEIAVKRLSKSSGQGSEEFKNEVSLVAKLQHRNLVKILGFCLQGVEKILIYEYIPNKSLDYILFGKALTAYVHMQFCF